MLASVEKTVVSLVSRKLAVGLASSSVSSSVLRPSSFSSGAAVVASAYLCRPYSSSSRYSHDRQQNYRSSSRDNRSSFSSRRSAAGVRDDGGGGGVGRGSRSRRDGQQDRRHFDLQTVPTREERGGTRAKDFIIPNRNPRPRKSRAEIQEEMLEMSMAEYKKTFRQEIRQYGDPMDEPDPQVFSAHLRKHYEDTEVMKDRIKTFRQTKKHFKHLLPKEVSLLTWAEKENIRYLHDTDPHQWTPEAISQAYPISPEGVVKLVKGSMRLRTVKEVKEHDTNVKLRMKAIQDGEFEMTEELEKKLRIRELMPLRVGHLGMNPEQYVDTGLPRELGEFASMVVPPSKKKKKLGGLGASREEQEPVIKCLTDGDLYDPSTTPISSDDDPLKPQLSEEELETILPRGKRMTFSEFEYRMETKGAGQKAGDMKYMLEELPPPEATTTSHHVPPSPNEIELPFGKGYNPQFPATVQKYQKPEDEPGQMLEIQVEGEQAYLYQAETGYQKPYGAPSTSRGGDPPERIHIPEEYRGKPGATYKLGSCYYDEDGEFLYKVI